MSSYAPPSLTESVVLQPGYTPPPAASVILCPVGPDIGGALHVEIPPPLPPTALAGQGRANYPGVLGVFAPAPLPAVSARLGQQPPRTAPDLWAAAPVPNAHELPAAPAAAGTIGHRARLSAAQAAPLPPAAFRGRERAYLAALAVVAPPPWPSTVLTAWVVTGRRADLAGAAAPIIVPPAATGSIRQDLALADAAGVASRLPYRRARPLRATALAAPHAEAERTRTRAAARHADTLPTASGARCAWAEASRTRRPIALRHAHGSARQTHAALRHADSLRTRRPVTLRHAHGPRRGTAAALPHADQLRRRPALAVRHAEALPAGRALAIGHALRPPLAAIRLHVRSSDGMPPPAGRWWPVYEPPGLVIVIPCAGGYIPRPLHCDVVLGPGYETQPPCPITPPPRPIVVPVREVYYVLNTFSFALVGGPPVTVSDFRAGLDAESWAWTWSATAPAGALDLLRPVAGVPREVIATINGTALRLRVESIARERRHGRADLRIGGRSRSAELAAPHAPSETRSNATERTARQLAEDALTINGVPIGWTLDWQIDDWLVPAGAWNHTGTWMDAVTRIASAAGAIVQPHATERVLRILPLYPAAPWEWAERSPAIVLPEAVAAVENIEWADKPDYDTVYLAGTGILGHVTRAGAAGDLAAPMVTDELLSAPEATLQRGRAILSDTGRQARISLSLPVLPATGLILPGLLLDYTEQGITHRGLTRGVSVQVNFPKVAQTVEVETHESV